LFYSYFLILIKSEGGEVNKDLGREKEDRRKTGKLSENAI